MLQLNNIQKKYVSGEISIPALKGVTLNFRKSEFVSILGQSGCGKTTLLNIIGGLDRYTSGDLIIAGKTTKEYNDKDWDSYRNHTIGFVFQNYNLIMHLSILDNVEMALILAGLNPKERRKKALDALASVGLSEHIHKKPNQLSGGQMQRVAIARAIVNEPKIILADEPTGALDTETSIQIMEILKKLSQDRLVIMVTHNPDLANKYSTRIVNLLDGVVINDSNPYIIEDENIEISAKNIEKQQFTEKEKPEKKLSVHTTKAERTSMSFFTALKLSLQNLRTKKARTILTAIAGSIGIIGVALILALSNGFQLYVNKMQMDTLSSYPLTIEKNATDMTSLADSFSSTNSNNESKEADKIYVNKIMEKLLSTQRNNNLTQEYIDNVIKQIDSSLYYDIQYKNGLDLNIYKKVNLSNNPNNPLYNYQPANAMSSFSKGAETMSSYMGISIWSELLNNTDYIFKQYDLVYGNYPKNPTNDMNTHEVVLVLNKNGEITDIILQLLGFLENKDYYEYDDFINQEFKLVLNDDLYSFDSENQRYNTNKITETIYYNGITLKIVGILQLKSDTQTGSIGGAVAYLPSLTNYVLEQQMQSEIVTFQKANPTISALTGENLSQDEQSQKLEYEKLITQLGGNELPTKISIYPIDFASKEQIKSYLNAYNNEQEIEEDKVYYTDLMDLMVSTINTVINAISYVLIAFTSISLVVSSLMIGIITYVSVLERIKEIGILRSIGARKKDISRVFNAETLIIGFSAGLLGVLVTLILSIPINLILYALVDINGIAQLPLISAFVLVLISMGLTLIAGFIPAKIASNKDPVLALRSE